MLPNFFVIGAQKSGSSSLHSYLGLHPEIHMSRVKEPNFFVPEDALALLWGIPEDALALRWEGQRDARQEVSQHRRLMQGVPGAPEGSRHQHLRGVQAAGRRTAVAVRG